MKEPILTRSTFEEIENRMRTGTVSNKDIELLLHTCRHLLFNDRSASGVSELKRGTGKRAKLHKETVAPVVNGLVEIFSDGACQGNPGPGGWGAIVREGEGEREISGRNPCTTNNRMELMGVIEALKSLKSPRKVILTTDSQYVQKGITAWINAWKRNGWKTASKEPVKNQDLWVELDRLNQKHEIEWRWIRGHNGHAENERCDELARLAVSGIVKG